RHAGRGALPAQQPGGHAAGVVVVWADHHVLVAARLDQLVQRGAEGAGDRGELVEGDAPVPGLDAAQGGRGQEGPGRELVQGPATGDPQTTDAQPDQGVEFTVLRHTQDG